MFWIVFQVAAPFFQKFELPSFRYRYARFSWAMYSRLVPVYELRLFRLNKAGQEEAIPGIERYVKGYQSPGPMRKRLVYMTPQEFRERLERLATFIAKERQDGCSYVASVRWIKYADPQLPERWEFRADAIS